MPNQELTFTMQPQVETHWCWAANATSISLFYDGASAWTQCKVASSTLGMPNCCSAPLPVPCNQDYYLDQALTTTGNFDAPVLPNALVDNDISAQIDAGKVIGVRIGWSGGGGHFVTIHGYNSSAGAFFVYVADPIYGKSFINLGTFSTNYQGSGSWTHSFYTKSTAGSMLQFTNINSQLLQKATDMRLSMLTTLPSLEETEQTDLNVPSTSLSNPHEVYTVTFKSLKDGDEPDIRKGGFRVMDTGNKDRKIFDFSDSSPDAHIQQVIHDTGYNFNYNRILDGVIRRQRNDPKNYILRILRQPELKIEAFWLHVKGHHDEDLFTPVINTPILEPGQYYSKKDFFNTLGNAAKNRRVSDDSMLGG